MTGTAPFKDQIIIVKCGGETLESAETLANLITQLMDLRKSGAKIVLVHGGGGQIKTRTDALGIAEQKINGVRITCKDTLAVVDEVLTGLNRSLTETLNAMEDCAVGMAGYDFITADQVPEKGFVGEPSYIDTAPLKDPLDAGKIIVVHPVCHDGRGQRLNVNADSVAGAIGRALKAKRVVFCTGAPGVLDKGRKTIPSLTPAAIAPLIADGTVTDGMVKKLEECVALLDGVEGVAIVGAADKNSIVRQLSGAGGGTLIQK